MSKIKKFIKRNKMFSLLAVAAIAIILVGVFAPVIATHSPYESNLHDAFIAPNSEHIFGTDKLGRDIFDDIFSRNGTCYCYGRNYGSKRKKCSNSYNSSKLD